MAAKSSDLVDKMSGANFQADGHAEVPTQSVKDLQEPEEEDSSPVPLPAHHLDLQPRGHHPAALIQNIFWRYE